MISLPRCLFASALLATTAIVAHARIDRVVEKSFPASASGVLRVETHGGEIRVERSKDATVRIVAKQKIKADTEREADELLKNLELTLEQVGNEVRAISKYPGRPSGFRFGSWPPVQVDFVISVPAAFATNLNTSGGAIVVSGLDGPAEMRTSGGNITLGQMGGTVDARTSGGNVTLDGARGAVKLRTSGGNIVVGRVEGPAEVSTSGGNINVESVIGALKADTSGGNIRAQVLGPLRDDCVLSTSGGTVRVTVDKAAAFRLDASTSGGSVDAEGLAVASEQSNRSRSRLAGAVNGGGPLLKLRSSGGGIVVRAN